MTVRAFADTNIAVYAESDDGDKSKRARTIIEATPVVSAQVINETIRGSAEGQQPVCDLTMNYSDPNFTDLSCTSEPPSSEHAKHGGSRKETRAWARAYR